MAFIFRFKHTSFYLQSEIFLFAGSLHVSSLHDGTVLHAGCRWPRVPHVARVSVYSHSHTRLADWLAGPCRGPGPANVMSQPLLSLTCDHWPSLSRAAHLMSPGLVCPRIMSLASLFTLFSCHCGSQVQSSSLTGPELVFTAWWQESHYGAEHQFVIRSPHCTAGSAVHLYTTPEAPESESPGGDFTN